MADAVVVLPLVDDQTVVMIRNERFAVGEVLWELCAGTLEKGEEPLLCAGRELIEETGYEAGRIDKLLEFYTCPGICTERMHAFLARDLTAVGQNLEDNERIEVEVMSLARSMQMIRSGEIRDGKTIATLFYYDRFIRAMT
jgi:ADP-ribose pyrophosphatase